MLAEPRPPTERQLELHAFMLSFRERHGVWPTVREIGAALGIASSNGVMDHLRAMKRKGLTRQRPRCARGWIAIALEPAADAW